MHHSCRQAMIVVPTFASERKVAGDFSSKVGVCLHFPKVKVPFRHFLFARLLQLKCKIKVVGKVSRMLFVTNFMRKNTRVKAIVSYVCSHFDS